MKRRVVVTGIGVVTSLSCEVEDLWARVCNGESGIRPIERFDASYFRSRIGGELQGWSTEGYMPSNEAKRLDRFAQFALVGAVDAVNESGLDLSKTDVNRCGVILGSGVGGLREIEVQHSRMIDRGPANDDFDFVPEPLYLQLFNSLLHFRHGCRQQCRKP